MTVKEELWVLHRDTETGRVRRMERVPIVGEPGFVVIHAHDGADPEPREEC